MTAVNIREVGHLNEVLGIHEYPHSICLNGRVAPSVLTNMSREDKEGKDNLL
jgi:hypothetical protein